MASEDFDTANGFSAAEKPLTLTLTDDQKHHQENNDSEDELETPNGSEGSDDAIKILHEEIQGLRRDRAELQRRMEEMLAEMENSEVGTKALAANASYLEGELAKTQEYLASASFVAEEAENEAKKLRSEKESIKTELEEKIADLDVERGKKEGEIRVLKEELRVSALKEEQLKERIKELELRIDEIVIKSRETSEEEAKVRVLREEELARVIKVMKERNAELEEDLVNQKRRREEEMEKTVKELKEKNSKLQEKIESLTNERSREMGVLMEASSSKVSWAMAAATAASTGTVAAAITVFYLRHRRQR